MSILFYFVVVTDLNPYSRDTQQDAYDKREINSPASIYLSMALQPLWTLAAF
jgi:hypothetical protein